MPGNGTLLPFHHGKELNFVFPGEKNPKKSAPATLRQYTKAAPRDEQTWLHTALSKEAESERGKEGVKMFLITCVII